LLVYSCTAQTAGGGILGRVRNFTLANFSAVDGSVFFAYIIKQVLVDSVEKFLRGNLINKVRTSD